MMIVQVNDDTTENRNMNEESYTASNRQRVLMAITAIIIGAFSSFMVIKSGIDLLKEGLANTNSYWKLLIGIGIICVAGFALYFYFMLLISLIRYAYDFVVYKWFTGNKTQNDTENDTGQCKCWLSFKHYFKLIHIYKRVLFLLHHRHQGEQIII